MMLIYDVLESRALIHETRLGIVTSIDDIVKLKDNNNVHGIVTFLRNIPVPAQRMTQFSLAPMQFAMDLDKHNIKRRVTGDT